MERGSDEHFALGLDARFEVVREIGRGGAARVFEVYDRLSDHPRALKVATRRGLRQRLRHEYQRCAELRHSNIVRVYDFGFSDLGLPYYTMELVRGVPLDALVERRQPLVLAAVAMQTLDALATLHARGWVHRDIKPANILAVGDPGALLVRLIDLGLLAPMGRSGRASGTLPYIAPEVARGEAVDGRADLYSLGVVLYEALVPGGLETDVAALSERLHTKPVAPSELDASVPSALSDFIMRLLEPEADKRFADALAAAEALARIAASKIGNYSPRTRAERLLRGGATSHRTRLVRRLRRVIRDAIDEGRGYAACLEAGIGVGKTPLMRELGMVLNLDGLRVVHLAVTQLPASPLPALLHILRAIAPQHRLAATDEVGLIDTVTDSAQWMGFAARLGTAVAQALRERPTALLIDDLHLAEAVGLELVRSLVEASESQPLVVIAASETRRDAPRLGDALGAEIESFALEPLSSHEIAALIAHRLRGLVLPDLVLHRLTQDSRGMPSLVERTVARFVADGVVVRDGGRYRFVGGRYRTVQYGDRDQVRSRLELVSEHQRPVLWAAAVLGYSVQSRDITDMLEGAAAEVATVLAELVQLGVMQAGEALEEPTFRFVSRRLLASCYHEIPLAERQRLHDRAAALLDGRARGLGRQEERVEHLLKGSDADAAVAAAIAAGERAAQVHADRRAIEYYARAYARLPHSSDPRAADLALRLGHLFERAGELERAATWYQASVTVAEPERHEGLEATLGQGNVALRGGDLALAEEQAARALALVRDSHPAELRVGAARLSALVASQRGDAEVAEARLLEALALSATEDLSAPSVRVLLDLAVVATKRGQFVRAARYGREALRRARKRRDLGAIAEANTVLGRGFMRAGRFFAARRALIAALRNARASGDRLRQAAVLRQVGNLRLREGDPGGALERYERSLELVRAAQARAEESICLHHIGVLRAMLAQYQAAGNALRASREVARECGDVLADASAAFDLAQVALQVGALADARALLDDLRQGLERLANPALAAKCRALEAVVAFRGGDRAPAEALVGSVASLAVALEDPIDRALLFWLAGRLALETGHEVEALQLAEGLLHEVEQGSLLHLLPVAEGMMGYVAEDAGAREDGLRLAAQAAARAQEQGLRATEIELRGWLGHIQQGTDRGAEELTLAMERARVVASELTPEMRETYLQLPELVALRRAFRVELRRLGLRDKSRGSDAHATWRG